MSFRHHQKIAAPVKLFCEGTRRRLSGSWCLLGCTYMLPWSARADCFKLQHCCHRLNIKIMLLKVPKLNSKLMDRNCSSFLVACGNHLPANILSRLPKLRFCPRPHTAEISLPYPQHAVKLWNSWIGQVTQGYLPLFWSLKVKKPLHHSQIPCKFLQAEQKGEKALPWLCLLWQIPFNLPVCIANVSYF